MNNKSELLKIFLQSIALTLALCMTMGGVGVFMYKKYIFQDNVVVSIGENVIETISDPEEIQEMVEIDKTINKTLAIFGTDRKGLLTDVIMVANFNSETNQVHIISVPRDTYVEWSESQRELLPSRNSWVRESKINEMVPWGGLENIRGLTVYQLERFLGIKIDNYVVVTLDAFEQVVDAIGGVELYVPQNMKYTDPYQNLYIDLKEGYQHLDGAKAEMFVRFRSYPTGDLARIDAQQIFLEAFIEKVLSPSIVSKVPGIISVAFNSVTTDIRLLEINEYLPYLTEVDPTQVYFHTMPGAAEYINNISYFLVDMEKTGQLVDDIFFNNTYGKESFEMEDFNQ
ncbi:MAG: hypothetical protein ATN36_01270 [Epulopiscium sp. Nele67-Bin005]|nr:MAG: hypothetical protein ATN36_01270 [Epulopiscium sp. Nele67-Bin005]